MFFGFLTSHCVRFLYQWPDLVRFLPLPENLSRPPRYVADILIRLYFDELHCAFPVLSKLHMYFVVVSTEVSCGAPHEPRMGP